MRKAINDNPIAQVAVVAVLLLACGVLLYTRVISGNAGSEEQTTAPGADTAAPAAPAPEGIPAAPAAPTPDAAVPPTGDVPAAPRGAFVAGRGLPRDVVAAHRRGKAVVLLIMKRQGIEDRAVMAAVERLRGRSDAAVFVTAAKDVARYSQITNGVGLDRVPALVVVAPGEGKSGMPAASVSYGFRGPDSVLQALRDVLYKGKKLPYHPG